MLNAREGVRVRGRAHHCFVREEAARDAVADRLLDARADDAARGSLWIEGADENRLEGGPDHVGVPEDYRA